MNNISITKKISITTIGLIAMLMLLAAPMYAGKASAKDPGGEKAEGSQWGGMTSDDGMNRNDAIQASSLMDKEVQDAEGNKIGSVADMMIGSDGNVEYIVLSQGNGFMGMGKKNLVPVPWSKVNTRDIGKDQETVTLSLGQQELENAPKFNKKEWQAFLRGERQQEVRGYFGTEDARQSGQEQMMNENPGMNTGETFDMKKKKSEVERKGGGYGQY